MEKVPVSARFFAKETLPFIEINPQSSQFKNNSIQALFYSFWPLSFLIFEPAVHPWLFHVLAPGSIG